MKLTFAYLSAGLQFMKEMVGPRDPIVIRSSDGLTLLQDWPTLHEHAGIQTEESRLTDRAQIECKTILYCYQGSHVGECFFIRTARTTVSDQAGADIVLTTTTDTPVGEYVFTKEGETLELASRSSQPFELNGRPVHQAKLVDYDEIALAGNRFLVLDIEGGQR